MDFDEKAQEWDNDPVKLERAAAVAAAIRNRVRLSPDLSALEYGCGTGLLSFALYRELGSITLADSSAGMLAVLREKIAASGTDHLRPMRLDLTVDPLPAERYDLIYTLMTLHHVSDVDRILRDFHALLRPDGALCIADLDREDGSFHGAGFDGHHGFEREALRDRLARAGFGEIQFDTCYMMRKPQGEGAREYPVFLAVARKA
ncbi:class I SAM-dependent methyltransferase [Candidatus Competibacter phosphatis]|uniref:Class I SAM-dependent methyltransferase n=1 Tax=Candidatus Competibacter phosphatis TaxID=221280 RepID=A0ABX1THT1_9GAMM|nr:class I SAM-dependent methyltransferase [Candidatus Competibacter phosphatis]NMQ18331.1 class I SAM-dependent methyltransferase [Candidatus Competibacter phosphatis]